MKNKLEKNSFSTKALIFWAVLAIILFISFIRVPYVGEFIDDIFFKFLFGYSKFFIYAILFYFCVTQLFLITTYGWFKKTWPGIMLTIISTSFIISVAVFFTIFPDVDRPANIPNDINIFTNEWIGNSVFRNPAGSFFNSNWIINPAGGFIGVLYSSIFQYITFVPAIIIAILLFTFGISWIITGSFFGIYIIFAKNISKKSKVVIETISKNKKVTETTPTKNYNSRVLFSPITTSKVVDNEKTGVFYMEHNDNFESKDFAEEKTSRKHNSWNKTKVNIVNKQDQKKESKGTDEHEPKTSKKNLFHPFSDLLKRNKSRKKIQTKQHDEDKQKTELEILSGKRNVEAFGQGYRSIVSNTAHGGENTTFFDKSNADTNSDEVSNIDTETTPDKTLSEKTLLENQEDNLQIKSHGIKESSDIHVPDADTSFFEKNLKVNNFPPEENLILKSHLEKETISKEQKETIEQNHEGVVFKGKRVQYNLPHISLLHDTSKKVDKRKVEEYAREISSKIKHVFSVFSIKIQVNSYIVGPKIIKYEIQTQPGVRISKVTQLENEIKLELAVTDLRIEAPIPGKSAIGIEIPNPQPELVTFKEMVEQIPKKCKDNNTCVVVGKNIYGESIFAFIDSLPHLLIAGATGSGKSVCINNFITFLILNSKPSDLRLLLIDPKRVELSFFKKVPHLLSEIVVDSKKAVFTLKKIEEEMDNRYKLLHDLGFRNVKDYNDHQSNYEKQLPTIVVFIDELADLMKIAGKEVEGSIQRISQLARAASIHLIVATQRPSADILTGVIKANIPARLSFRLPSAIDSRTILDQKGAESLLGRGDLLFIDPLQNSVFRLQSPLISDSDLRRLINHVSAKTKQRFETKFTESDI